MDLCLTTDSSIDDSKYLLLLKSDLAGCKHLEKGTSPASTETTEVLSKKIASFASMQ